MRGQSERRVTSILEEDLIDLGGTLQTYQILRVEILEGEYEGIPFEIDYGKRQLHAADETLGFHELVTRAMRIGQNHVAATVNTLVLAYAGASLPSLLMFSLNRGDYSILLNFEFIAEEVVRTLVGSLGLIAAVPITTAIAAALALYHHRFGEWRWLLGPESSGGGHVH